MDAWILKSSRVRVVFQSILDRILYVFGEVFLEYSTWYFRIDSRKIRTNKLKFFLAFYLIEKLEIINLILDVYAFMLFASQDMGIVIIYVFN